MVHIHLSALDALNVSVVGDDEELFGNKIDFNLDLGEWCKYLC